jgi:hypothetical protein
MPGHFFRSARAMCSPTRSSLWPRFMLHEGTQAPDPVQGSPSRSSSCGAGLVGGDVGGTHLKSTRLLCRCSSLQGRETSWSRTLREAECWRRRLMRFCVSWKRSRPRLGLEVMRWLLRHTVAVRALEVCPKDRDQLTSHVLALSTYLGHASLRDTYWYLQATPQLLRDVPELQRVG